MSIVRAVVDWWAAHLMFLVTFAVGLSLDWTELRRKLRTGPLLRGIAVALLVVPLLAFVVALMLPLTPRARGLLFLTAISPGLPLAVASVRRHDGNVALAAALSACLSLAAIVTMPLYVTAVNAGFDFDLYASPRSLVGVVASAVIVPLGAGAALRLLLPDLAPRLCRVVDIAFKLSLVLVGVAALILGVPMLHYLKVWTLLAMVLVVAGATLLGHLAGGPRPEDRVTVAVAAVFGSPALTLRVSEESYPELHLPPLVFAYLIVRALAFLPYLQWRRHTAPPISAASAAPR
jgi:BASS family bile acid:Na+ symporter